MDQKKIGLTGGIGSGKTTASTIFQKLGVPVFNSDKESEFLLNNNREIIQEVVEKIGSNILLNDQINRQKLAQIVFSDKKKLTILNKIIHPKVSQLFNQWTKKQKSKYIIKESAILFESNTNNYLDKIILMKSPLKLRIQRVCLRDNRTKKDVENIINNQKKTREIEKYADYILNNNKNSMLASNVIQLHKKLTKL
tara:strand:- start:1438 stop:2025 length:588 start_codon:yes stop_codon:yes gene_type:complete